ncbi:hypothetical protein N658DRAFT_235215 [Parathielavia hyrcaniae]|uniref:Uncharacterized protein n=1 Tax=Parathielavia hyrcaniae TaxID=113614 RepID=A0AAN6Q6P3_9PEZI|nr:hypothetical protein N658DRAFT_235215 [Parathielavia hyrcaniae]
MKAQCVVTRVLQTRLMRLRRPSAWPTRHFRPHNQIRSDVTRPVNVLHLIDDSTPCFSKTLALVDQAGSSGVKSDSAQDSKAVGVTRRPAQPHPASFPAPRTEPVPFRLLSVNGDVMAPSKACFGSKSWKKGKREGRVSNTRENKAQQCESSAMANKR